MSTKPRPKGEPYRAPAGGWKEYNSGRGPCYQHKRKAETHLPVMYNISNANPSDPGPHTSVPAWAPEGTVLVGDNLYVADASPLGGEWAVCTPTFEDMTACHKKGVKTVTAIVAWYGRFGPASADVGQYATEFDGYGGSTASPTMSQLYLSSGTKYLKVVGEATASHKLTVNGVVLEDASGSAAFESSVNQTTGKHSDTASQSGAMGSDADAAFSKCGNFRPDIWGYYKTLYAERITPTFPESEPYYSDSGMSTSPWADITQEWDDTTVLPPTDPDNPNGSERSYGTWTVHLSCNPANQVYYVEDNNSGTEIKDKDGITLYSSTHTAHVDITLNVNAASVDWSFNSNSSDSDSTGASTDEESHRTAEIDFQTPFTFGDCETAANNLLAAWNLADDIQIPWGMRISGAAGGMGPVICLNQRATPSVPGITGTNDIDTSLPPWPQFGDGATVGEPLPNNKSWQPYWDYTAGDTPWSLITSNNAPVGRKFLTGDINCGSGGVFSIIPCGAFVNFNNFPDCTESGHIMGDYVWVRKSAQTIEPHPSFSPARPCGADRLQSRFSSYPGICGRSAVTSAVQDGPNVNVMVGQEVCLKDGDIVVFSGVNELDGAQTVTGLGSSLVSTAAFKVTAALLTVYRGGGYVTTASSSLPELNDDHWKGDFMLGAWTLARASYSAPMLYNSVFTDNSLPFSPCWPTVICFSPNANEETGQDIFENGVTVGMGSVQLDIDNGGLWQGNGIPTLGDPLSDAIPTPQVEARTAPPPGATMPAGITWPTAGRPLPGCDGRDPSDQT